MSIREILFVSFLPRTPSEGLPLLRHALSCNIPCSMSQTYVSSSDGCGNDSSHRARPSRPNTWSRSVRKWSWSRCPPSPTPWRGRVLLCVLFMGTCPWVLQVQLDRRDHPDLPWVRQRCRIYNSSVHRQHVYNPIIRGLTQCCSAVHTSHPSDSLLKCKHIAKVWTGQGELQYLAERLGMKTVRFSTSPWGQIRSHRLDTWCVLNGFWRGSRLSLDWKGFSTFLNSVESNLSTPTSLLTMTLVLTNAHEALHVWSYYTIT